MKSNEKFQLTFHIASAKILQREIKEKNIIDKAAG